MNLISEPKVQRMILLDALWSLSSQVVPSGWSTSSQCGRCRIRLISVKPRSIKRPRMVLLTWGRSWLRRMRLFPSAERSWSWSTSHWKTRLMPCYMFGCASPCMTCQYEFHDTYFSLSFAACRWHQLRCFVVSLYSVPHFWGYNLSGIMKAVAWAIF